MIPVIGLLAIPLSRVNHGGVGTRLVPAMILCFLYVIALSAGKSGIEREVPAEYGLWWIHGVFLLITFVIWHLEKITKIVRY